MIAGDDAPGAGHVCHRESRVTRDEASEMAGENPRIHVSTAARGKTDNDPHDFAAIEIRYPTVIDIRALALRRQSRSCRSGEQEKNQCRYRSYQFFTSPPVPQCTISPGRQSPPAKLSKALLFRASRLTSADTAFFRLQIKARGYRLAIWKPTANSK